MEVKIRKLKRAWAYCNQDNSHGQTQYELIIKSDNNIYPLKTWLCPNCLIEFKNKIDNSIGEIKK